MFFVIESFLCSSIYADNLLARLVQTPELGKPVPSKLSMNRQLYKKYYLKEITRGAAKEIELEGKNEENRFESGGYMANDRNPPCKQGQVLAVEITDLNHRGEGVGKTGGFTLFVPQALPGEIARVEISAVRKNFAGAKLLTLEQSSPHRVNPPCPYFPECGGCQIQHLSYEKQLAWKNEKVFETLRRIAGAEPSIQPVLGTANPWRYRNKAQVHLGIANDRVKTGFYQQRSHQIIDITDCLVQHPHNGKMINAIRQAAQEFADRKTIPAGEDPLPANRAAIRSSFSTGKSMIILTGAATSKNSPLFLKTYLQKLADLINFKAKEPPAGIILHQPDKAGDRHITLSGQPYLEENIAPFHYRLSPRSFFQVNPGQAGILYEQAASLSGRPRTAYDLYCGTGNFALYLSKTAEQVIGIDSDGSAIKDANENAALNKIGNIQFINARAEDVTDLLIKGNHPKTVFLNPPRQGCSPGLLEAIIRAKPERIVYISCSPATLARDIDRLQQSSYAVKLVQPVDMFPHTSHVESVALIERRQA